jgi:hypothetical protein
MFNQEVPGERELLGIFRKLSPAMRQSILKITQDLLEVHEKSTAATKDDCNNSRKKTQIQAAAAGIEAR